VTENLQLGVAKDDKKMPQKTKSNRNEISYFCKKS